MVPFPASHVIFLKIKADIFRTSRSLAGDHCWFRQWLSSRLAMYQEGLHRSLLEDQEWMELFQRQNQRSLGPWFCSPMPRGRDQNGRLRSDSLKSGRDPDIFQGKRCNVRSSIYFQPQAWNRNAEQKYIESLVVSGDQHPGLAEGGGEHQISSMSWAHHKVRWLCKWSWLRRVESLQEGIEMWRCGDLIPAYSSGFYLLVNS